MPPPSTIFCNGPEPEGKLSGTKYRNHVYIQTLYGFNFRQDYAATLVNAVKKWFCGPLYQGKIPEGFHFGSRILPSTAR
jgi:hypothetical protein